MNGNRSKGQKSLACAACKYQRRKCSGECPLAPYFPAERGKEFMKAHKLFGVGNILKVLKKVGPEAREEAVKSIIFEANAREADPVEGCYGIVLNLMKQIEMYQTELHLVMHRLNGFRAF